MVQHFKIQIKFQFGKRIFNTNLLFVHIVINKFDFDIIVGLLEKYIIIPIFALHSKIELWIIAFLDKSSFILIVKNGIMNLIKKKIFWIILNSVFQSEHKIKFCNWKLCTIAQRDIVSIRRLTFKSNQKLWPNLIKKEFHELKLD